MRINATGSNPRAGHRADHPASQAQCFCHQAPQFVSIFVLGAVRQFLANGRGGVFAFRERAQNQQPAVGQHYFEKRKTPHPVEVYISDVGQPFDGSLVQRLFFFQGVAVAGAVVFVI